MLQFATHSQPWCILLSIRYIFVTPIHALVPSFALDVSGMFGLSNDTRKQNCGTTLNPLFNDLKKIALTV